MRKTKAKATAKVDALLAEPFTNDEEFMQRIVDQAQAESMRRMDEQPVKTKKKGLWRGAPALCALVIILLVAPILAVIVNPVCFSKANQLVRKATIWVNDTFKLGIELPVEDDVDLKQEAANVIFSTVEEAVSYLGKGFPALEETDETKLVSIEIADYSEVAFITQKYDYKGNEVLLTVETILDHYIEVPSDNAIQIINDLGTLWLWSTNNTYRAVGIIDEWSVDLYTTVGVKNTEDLLYTLKWLN